jgi:hypothetical protein
VRNPRRFFVVHVYYYKSLHIFRSENSFEARGVYILVPLPPLSPPWQVLLCVLLGARPRADAGDNRRARRGVRRLGWRQSEHWYAVVCSNLSTGRREEFPATTSHNIVSGAIDAAAERNDVGRASSPFPWRAF